jgi:curved DNA-binding protein
MDYYNILGIPKTADAEEIKKAYRRLAAKHHPDRGGDTAEFQKVEEAYRTLSDPQTRAEYDNPHPQFSFNSSNFNQDFADIFGNFGFGGFRQQTRVQRNKNINIQVKVTLKDVILGKEVIGNIRLPSGRDQAIQLNIPPGVSHGDTIRFKELGDDSIPNIHRGDLIAQIIEIPSTEYHRDGRNIIMNYSISPFDAILGKKITIVTLEDKELEVSIPAGIQPGQLVKCAGHGIPVHQSRHRGDLFIHIKVNIPKDINEEDKLIVEKLQIKYS